MNNIEFVGIAGDWHGNVSHALLALEKLDHLEVKYIFQLGDFGLFGSLLKHSHEKMRHRINRLLVKNDQYLFVTFGNHENYDLAEKIPHITKGEFAGFRQEPEAERIFYFERGQSLTIGGRNFLSIGGAASIDYAWRWARHLAKPNSAKVWWEQEKITMSDVQKTVAEAERLGHVDVLLAHDVFASAPITGTHRQDTTMWTSDELEFAQTSRDALERVVTRVLPTVWLHGHYHARIENEVVFPVRTTAKKSKGKFSVEKKVVRTHCLGKDDGPHSTAVLFLNDLSLEYID